MMRVLLSGRSFRAELASTSMPKIILGISAQYHDSAAALVVDGEVVDTVALSEDRESVVRFEGVLGTNLDRDAFVIVVVEGDAPMDPLYPGKLPFAFTNPLFVDGDGDGTWTPPRGF